MLHDERQCRFVWLTDPPLDYAEALSLQYLAHSARRDSVAPDTVYFLQHRPTITVGRSAPAGGAHIRTDPAALAASGVVVIEVDRGGDVTYHAPGQLVIYPILHLDGHGRDLHRYLRRLEEAIIDTLATYGVGAVVVAGRTGVWVEGRKIAAIGIKVSRWVSMHGAAVNIDLDLAPMRRDIVPCGIVDADVTSLAELGISATASDLAGRLVESLRRKFDVSGALEPSSLALERARLANALARRSEREAEGIVAGKMRAVAARGIDEAAGRAQAR